MASLQQNDTDCPRWSHYEGWCMGFEHPCDPDTIGVVEPDCDRATCDGTHNTHWDGWGWRTDTGLTLPSLYPEDPPTIAFHHDGRTVLTFRFTEDGTLDVEYDEGSLAESAQQAVEAMASMVLPTEQMVLRAAAALIDGGGGSARDMARRVLAAAFDTSRKVVHVDE